MDERAGGRVAGAGTSVRPWRASKGGGLEKVPAAGGDHKPVFATAAVSSPPEQKPFVTAAGELPPAFPELAAYYDRPSDSMPRLHADYSSCSEQVLSPEQLACDREVQSQPKFSEWERTFASDPVNPAGSMLDPVVGHAGSDPLLQDILMYWGKPF
ncbi:hypothetical protein ZEAMMB73_Zm00001d013904 [Zea mays]|uniref:Uncharacterized protein n=1 Tax=Zea mays TaxID=4577 RepID=A0A1D6GNG5_MAIZE|nr:hypothetical protein ZEAMMB73_Zm00001d013904 [Zea mays]